MRRRDFITLVGGGIAVRPLAAQAQQAGKLPTIGFLVAGTPTSHGQWVAAFMQRLRELDWIEGRTITIEYRWAEGRDERFAEIAAELVRRQVDVIVTSATAAIVAAKQATSVIPIVFAAAGDPVGIGLVARLVWRDRAATLPVCRSSKPILRPSESNFCARLSRVSAGWRSWVMSAVPTWCWICARPRPRPARLGWRSSHQKSDEARTSRPCSRRSKAARRHFMSLTTRS